MPFYAPDLTITVVDPHRPGHESSYYPGETNVRLADVVVVNKVDSAERVNVDAVITNVRRINPGARIVEARSPITVEDATLIKGKKVLVIEDGPTLTHGEMSFGAGVIAAQQFGASEIVEPRPFAVESIAETYRKYPNTGALLPAMGYGKKQMKDLETTIARIPCDTVVIGTPIDLRRVITIRQPSVRVSYSLEETTTPTLTDIIAGFLRRKKKR
jgi:predicted GTPase